jgi:hypothetical protein
MEHPEEHHYSRSTFDTPATSGKTSMASCFSRESSSTSPGLGVIDPRIIGAQNFIDEEEPQSSNLVTGKSQSLSHTLDGHPE